MLYEFYKLDSEQFRYYIIGLGLYNVAVIFVFLQYVVLPPLTHMEYALSALFLYSPGILGAFFILKGTRYLVQQENPTFSEKEKLYTQIKYLVICAAIYTTAYHPSILISVTLFRILNIVPSTLYFIITLLMFKLLFVYKKNLNPIISSVVTLFVTTILLFIIGSIIFVQSQLPIRYNGYTYTDLSYLNQILALIGAYLIFISFLFSYLTISKFRRILTG